MTTLKKYYEFISRSATISLTDATGSTTYYIGALKNIPDEYDNCEVIDFNVNNEGDIHFQIKQAETVTKSADSDRLWHEGALRVYGESFKYWIKQYDEGSEYGIDEGRVSKLCIKRDGITVCNYDRGWDIKPVDKNTQLALEILLHEYNG